MGLMPTLILGRKKNPISDILADIIYIISAECGYQILRQKYVMEAGYFTF